MTVLPGLTYIDMQDSLKTAADVAAGSVAIATILKWLPAVAALFTIIWTGIRIYDWLVEKRKK